MRYYLGAPEPPEGLVTPAVATQPSEFGAGACLGERMVR
jgi:hypothetical protein